MNENVPEQIRRAARTPPPQDWENVPPGHLPNPDYPGKESRRWRSARIPVQERARTINQLTALPEPLREFGRGFVDSFALRYADEDEGELPEDRSLLGRGATLLGPSRHGKTALACAIMTEIALQYSVSILYVPWADYVHAFNERHARSRSGDPDDERDLRQINISIERVMNTSLVTLDDVGREHSTASRAGADELERVLRSRHRRALPTIITSNLLLSDWEMAYSPVMAAFLLHELPPLVVDSGGALEADGR